MSQLTGFPSINASVKNETADSIWDMLDGHDTKSDIMTASSNYNAAGHNSIDDNGIAYSHAYTILGTETVKKLDGSSQRLLKLRNPWKRESYTGPWCDSCSEWNLVSEDEL